MSRVSRRPLKESKQGPTLRAEIEPAKGRPPPTRPAVATPRWPRPDFGSNYWKTELSFRSLPAPTRELISSVPGLCESASPACQSPLGGGTGTCGARARFPPSRLRWWQPAGGRGWPCPTVGRTKNLVWVLDTGRPAWWNTPGSAPAWPHDSDRSPAVNRPGRRVRSPVDWPGVGPGERRRGLAAFPPFRDRGARRKRLGVFCLS